MQSLTTAWAWITAHHVSIMLSLGALVGVLRAVPAPVWQRIERDWPRLANLVRLGRAIAPDVVKAAKVVFAIWTGRPWPALPAPLDPSNGEVLK